MGMHHYIMMDHTKCAAAQVSSMNHYYSKINIYNTFPHIDEQIDF